MRRRRRFFLRFFRVIKNGMYSIICPTKLLRYCSGGSKREINNDMLCPLATLMASAARTPGLLSESKSVLPRRAVFGHYFLSSEPTNTPINVIVIKQAGGCFLHAVLSDTSCPVSQPTALPNGSHALLEPQGTRKDFLRFFCVIKNHIIYVSYEIT
jgi:hypothetical protein